jgi:hypothetical protein
MAKRKYWEDLNDKETHFAQMPYPLLDSNELSNDAKIAFLHIWKDAFTSGKKNKGKHYSDMTQAKLAQLLGYKPCGGGIRKTRTIINELNTQQIVESKKQTTGKGNHYIHYFCAKHRWILGKVK